MVFGGICRKLRLVRSKDSQEMVVEVFIFRGELTPPILGGWLFGPYFLAWDDIQEWAWILEIVAVRIDEKVAYWSKRAGYCRLKAPR